MTWRALPLFFTVRSLPAPRRGSPLEIDMEKT